jgi:hypothetical protein
LAVNMVLPWLVYEVLTGRGWTEVQALMAVTVVPLVWGLAVLLRERRWDPVAAFSGGGMLLGLVTCAVSSDVRALQVRESYITLLLGLLFLGSALVRRPFFVTLARSQARASGPPGAVEHLEIPAVRHLLETLNLGWGLAFVLEFAARLWMIRRLTIAQVLALGPWLQAGLLGVTVLWTWWMMRRLQRRLLALAASAPRPPTG